MIRFFRKYELEFKILALAAWTFAAVDKIFFDIEEENRNFHILMGIVMMLLAIFYFFEVIELIKKRKIKNDAK
jgi:Na+/H+ antiporter NhaC